MGLNLGTLIYVISGFALEWVLMNVKICLPRSLYVYVFDIDGFLSSVLVLCA